MRRQKCNKIWMGMLQLLLAGIVLSGCGSAGKENEIHIGYFNNVTHAQALYMKSQGKLEEMFGEEVSVLWTAFNAGPAEVEALFSGQIDIGYIGPVPEPWGTTLEAAGAEIVLDYDEVYQKGDYPVAVVVVQNEFLKEHPKQVEQFLKAHQEATSYISTHTKEAASVIHEEMESATGKSLGEDVLAEAFSKIVFETQVNEKAINEFGEICREQGFIAKSYDNIFADFPID